MFSEKCWSRSVQEYGLEPAKMLQSIEFLDLLRKGKLSGAAFAHYESNDAQYLKAYASCWTTLMMQLDATTSAAHKEDTEAIAKIVGGLLEELAMVTKNAEGAAATETPAAARGPAKFVDGAKDLACEAFANYIALIKRLAGKALAPAAGSAADALAPVELCTALVPCMRLYAEVGKVLKAAEAESAGGNVPASQRAWMEAYGSAEFLANADKADRILDHLFASRDLNDAGAEDRLYSMYKKVMDLELAIFDFYAVPTSDAEQALASYPQALIVAGSDSGGGAGIQADMKTMEFFKVFSSVAITATTAQNTVGVQDVFVLPAPHVQAQIASCFSDYGGSLRVVKTGMLPNKEQIAALAGEIEKHEKTVQADVLLVLDPVMITATGHRLIDEEAVLAITKDLLPRATVVTPNLPEAAFLLDSTEAALAADLDGTAMRFAQKFPPRPGSVQGLLLKGGHIEGTVGAVDGADFVVDTLYLQFTGGDGRLPPPAPDAVAARALGRESGGDHLKVSIRAVEDTVNGGSMLAATFVHPRIKGPAGKLNDHGTGCSLASAVAAGLAKGLRPHPAAFGVPRPAALFAAQQEPQAALLVGALRDGIQFVSRAMRAATAVTIGQGHGPLLHHFGDCGP